MTQQGFEDFLYASYKSNSGAIKSYITAIRIIDELFRYNDVFGLKGVSITRINDFNLLMKISEFIRNQQSLYRRKEKSFFDNINPRQTSYPAKSFCSAAMAQLVEYYEYDSKENEAWKLLQVKSGAKQVSKELITIFDIDKTGEDKVVEARVRLGQSYFRKMVLKIYQNKCCVTGLNVPQILRASHIVAWAEDKANRMNPENGLCLSATYDAAFDKHLISFDADYRMIVSKELKEYYTSEITKTYFDAYEGKQIILPTQYLPSKNLLEKHRSLMVG